MEVKRFPYELDQSFEMRKLFISKFNPKSLQDFIEAKRLALIWVNFKFIGCKYPIDVMETIRQILNTNANIKHNKT